MDRGDVLDAEDADGYMLEDLSRGLIGGRSRRMVELQRLPSAQRWMTDRIQQSADWQMPLLSVICERPEGCARDASDH
jgi:hypothetical protein